MVLLNKQYSKHTHLWHFTKLLQHILPLTKANGGLLNHKKQTDRQRSVSRQEEQVTVYQVRSYNCRHDINITTLLLLHNYNSFVNLQPVCLRNLVIQFVSPHSSNRAIISTWYKLYIPLSEWRQWQKCPIDFFPWQLRYHEIRIT